MNKYKLYVVNTYKNIDDDDDEMNLNGILGM